MKRLEDYEKSFYEVGNILQKCKTYEVAKFIVAPYIMFEITDATLDDRTYYFFVEDGVYVIRTDKSNNILEVFTFDYSDLDIRQKYQIYEDINYCKPENRFERIKSYVRNKYGKNN